MAGCACWRYEAGGCSSEGGAGSALEADAAWAPMGRLSASRMVCMTGVPAAEPNIAGEAGRELRSSCCGARAGRRDAGTQKVASAIREDDLTCPSPCLSPTCDPPVGAGDWKPAKPVEAGGSRDSAAALRLPPENSSADTSTSCARVRIRRRAAHTAHARTDKAAGPLLTHRALPRSTWPGGVAGRLTALSPAPASRAASAWLRASACLSASASRATSSSRPCSALCSREISSCDLYTSPESALRLACEARQRHAQRGARAAVALPLAEATPCCSERAAAAPPERGGGGAHVAAHQVAPPRAPLRA